MRDAGLETKSSKIRLRPRPVFSPFSRQGHRGGARPMLAKIYHWFTERLDNADLKDAKALLDDPTSPA